MARPSKFSTDDILDAARAAVAIHGRDATLAEICEQISVPIGSIYHRFASREEVLGSLWLRSVRRLHAALFEAIDGVSDPNEALIGCALTMTRYCRTHPGEAVALTLYRQERLAAEGPESLRHEAASINDAIFSRLKDLCARRYPADAPLHVTLVRAAVVQLPYGLVRPYIGTTVPDWLDDIVRAATDAALALGDGTAGAFAASR